MEKYLQYVQSYHNNNKNEIFFIENQLKKHLQNNTEDQTEVEHILDYLYSTDKKFLSLGYKTIKNKTDKRNKKLQEFNDSSGEEEKVDYEIVKDFNDGFKFIKLISENAYKREGKLMSHCVASYFGREDQIYSLRDSKNNPHCTISDNSNQIKGKGNGKIDPKYINYVVQFLEHLGLSVSDNEMKNLGYENVEFYRDFLLGGVELFRNKYYYGEISKDIFKVKTCAKLDGLVDGVVLFLGNLNLYGYDHKLPDSFANCGGYLDLMGYNHKLPDSFTYCGGHLRLDGYNHKLPDSFTNCGGTLYLSGYNHKLPDSLTYCGGDLYLYLYNHKLPDSLTYCGGHLRLDGYNHKLPNSFTSCGGHLDLKGYNHKLPDSLTYCGGDLYLDSYDHKLPYGLQQKA